MDIKEHGKEVREKVVENCKEFWICLRVPFQLSPENEEYGQLLTNQVYLWQIVTLSKKRINQKMSMMTEEAAEIHSSLDDKKGGLDY